MTTTLNSQIAKRIQTSKKNVLCVHRGPDGDTVGSNLAFAAVLKAAGQEVDIFCIDTIPEHLQFVEGFEKVIIQSPEEIRWQNYDTFWALDMSAPDMLGKPVQFPPDLEIFVIDHHKTNENWGTHNLVDSKSVSCTAVLYELFKDQGIKYDAATGMALLTGLVTDTGFFEHIYDGKPLIIAADLIDTHKLSYQTIIYQIRKQVNIEDVLFLGNALSLLKVDYEHKAAILPIPNATWASLAGEGQKTYMLTGYISSINGTDFGMIIIEEKPGKFKVSMRSRNREFDVAAIAAKLNGGGHKNAAGALVHAESMDEAIAQIMAQI